MQQYLILKLDLFDELYLKIHLTINEILDQELLSELVSNLYLELNNISIDLLNNLEQE